MNEELTNVLVAVAVAIIPLIGSVLVAYLRKLLIALEEQARNQIGETQYNLLETIASTAVLAAEQSIFSGGRDKKTFAVNALSELCAQYNIAITDQQISMLVEAAVNTDTGWMPPSSDDEAAVAKGYSLELTDINSTP